MQIEADGIVVWFDTDDAPVSAPPEGPATVSVGVRPPDPSNAVDVVYRVNGAGEARVAARWQRTETLGGVQYFTAELPVRGGDRVDFSVVCRCAGRQAPTRGQPGAFASFTVGGSRDSAEEVSEERPRPAASRPSVPANDGDEPSATLRVHGVVRDRYADGGHEGLRVSSELESSSTPTRAVRQRRSAGTAVRLRQPVAVQEAHEPHGVRALLAGTRGSNALQLVAAASGDRPPSEPGGGTLYVEAAGLRLACDPPEFVSAGEPSDVVFVVAGATRAPGVDVSLSINGEPIGAVDVRASDIGPPDGAHAFCVALPAMADGDVAELTLVAREGDRRVPAQDDESQATITIPVRAVGEPANERPADEPCLSMPRTLSELVGGLSQPPADDFLDRLAAQEVTSPDLLLTRWTSGELRELMADDEPVVDELVAHAALATLPLTTDDRARLIEAGLRTPADVAAGTAEALAALLADAGAARGVHAAAAAQTMILGALDTARRVHRANGVPLAEPSPNGAATIGDETGGECGCEDCRAATSPMAYLADLLSYATQRMRWAGEPVTVRGLAGMLRQPLTDLPVDCAATEEEVAQVRLVIESIEELLRRELPATPDVAVAPVGHRITFVVSADVDGDSREELVIGFDEEWVTPGDPTRSGIWVMRYDTAAARWRHLRAGSDIRHATLLLPFGMHATSGFAARFRRDTAPRLAQRQQVVVGVTADDQPGARFWVLQYEPDAAAGDDAWTHLAPTMLAQFGADLVLPVDTVRGAFAADVDGDGVDEFVAYGVAPPAVAGGAERLNAFWVYDLVGTAWQPLAAAGSVADVAFTCYAPSVGPLVGVSYATAGDVDLDGREEIVALPEGELNGRFLWVMRYGGAPGQWAHVKQQGDLLDADINAPTPGPTANVLVGSVAAMDRPDIVVSRGEWGSQDVNRFAVWRYEPATVIWGRYVGAHFSEQPAADAATAPLPADIAILADVDGDGRDEIVALTHQGTGADRRDAAWVLDRDAAGAWTHLTPIAGHPLQADVEWTTGGRWQASSLVAADVDGDGRDELILSSGEANGIWVLDYDAAARAWRHMSPVIPPSAAQDYVLAAYEALLLQAGTSFAQLRQARSASDEDRQALAERLGISPAGSRPDALDGLVLHPATADMDQLESLFGLASTRRDPLSQGAVGGPGGSQLRRWRLEGARWSADPVCASTDPDGVVHLQLDRDARARATVTAYRDAARTAPVALGDGPADGTVRLRELRGSGLSGTVRVDLRDSTATADVRVFPVLAVHRWRRLRELWDTEDVPADPYRPGAASSDGVERRPIVDPAVISPDDLRLPLPKAPGAADGPFDLWIRRRAWLDDVIDRLRARGPNIDALLNSMRPATGTPPAGEPWAGAPSDLDTLAATLTGGTPEQVTAASRTVLTALRLPVDAFLRLLELRDLARARTARAEDWAELRSILALAHRRSQFETWRAEELAASIRLDAAAFVTTARPVTEGAWPPEPVPADQLPPGGALPWVDPDRVAADDLPRTVAGDEARALWRRRAVELAGNATTVVAARGSGWEQQLAAALGGVPAAAPDWVTWIGARATDLDSGSSTVIAAAVEAIRASLGGMGVAAFRRLAAVNATFADSLVPTEEARADAERLLAATRKVTVLYPVWRTEESLAGRPLPYWRVLRFALTPWQATAEDRYAWLAALALRCRPPVVDPDQVPLERIRTGNVPGLPCAAEQRRSERLSALDQREQALRAALTVQAGRDDTQRVDAALLVGLWTAAERDAVRADLAARRTATSLQPVVAQVFGADAAGFAALRADLAAGGATALAARRTVVGELGFSTEAAFRDLADLLAQAGAPTAAQLSAFDQTLTDAYLVSQLTRAERRADLLGIRVGDQLAPLRLSLAAWRRLLAVRALAVAGGPLLDAETDDLVAILVRSGKERRFGAWQAAEQDAPAADRVRLGPDSFTLPEDQWSLPEPPPWRVRPAEARAWRATLRARTEQHDGVLTALREAVARVETATMPAYRDKLLAALPVASTEPGAGARWVSDHLLVDTAESGLRRTARVAHAINTVLTLIWSVRTGQLRDTYPDLALDAPTFDQDWRWIGSYATWRSAVLVHLYPENLLRPTLRRYQSPALREALDDLRSARQLTPGQARRIAARYAEYLADVSRLDQRQILCAPVRTAWTPLLLVGDPGGLRDCQLLATISETSRRVYWALRDLSTAAVATGYELSFWHHLDQFPAGEVTALVGSTQYVPANWAGGKRWLFLFAQTQDVDGQRLAFLRYDLDTATWDSEPTSLEPPPGATDFTAWLFPTPPGAPPRVGFEYTVADGDQRETVRRARSLNPKGSNWAREDFVPIGAYATWQRVGPGAADYSSAKVAARQLLSGDIDGDGRDELVIIPLTDAPPVVLRFDGTAWGALPTAPVSMSIPADALVAVGRFVATDPADRRDDLAWVRESGRATLLRYTGTWDTGTWETIGDTTGWVPVLGARQVVAGDFDGDGRAELAVTSRSEGGLPGFAIVPGTSAFWILEATPQGLQPKASLIGHDPAFPEWRSAFEQLFSAAFRCARPPAIQGQVPSTYPRPGFVLAGDFDGDGRDEIAAAIEPVDGDLSQGNDFWVMDLRPGGRWAPLGEPAVNPEYPLYTVLDLSGADLRLFGAVAGDFDGDDRDEIAVIPMVERQGTEASLLIADFLPGKVVSDPAVNGRWDFLPNLVLSMDDTGENQVVAGDFDGDGADEVVVLGPRRMWLRKYDVAADTWIELPGGLLGPGDPTGFAFGVSGNLLGAAGQPLTPRRGARSDRVQDQLGLQPGTIAVVGGPGPFRQSSLRGTGTSPFVLTRRLDATPVRAEGCMPSGQLVPRWPSGEAWGLDDTVPERIRAARSRIAMLNNAGAPATVLRYLEEALYDLPVAVALALQASHAYDHALDWYRLVYDYASASPRRKTYYGLVLDEHGTSEEAPADPASYARDLLAWVRDPLNPHAIAAIRPHTYTRGTLQLLIRCLLDYADAEFTRDTPESIERARVLYETVHDLLDEPVLRQRLGGCDDIVVRIPTANADPDLRSAVDQLELELGAVPDRAAANAAAHAIGAVLDGNGAPAIGDVAHRILEAERIASVVLGAAQQPDSLGAALDAAGAIRRADGLTLTPVLGAARSAALADLTATTVAPLALALPRAPGIVAPTFCVSPNPMLTGLRLHAELNLFKLRNGRNIAGMRRTLDVYAAPTDQTSGLPMIGADGELVLPGLRSPAPTPYRYQALVEQARSLAAQARDAEAQMLASLEKRDIEGLSLLRARQEIRVARAVVQLQELRVHQAEDRVALAQLQQERATFEEQHYTDLVSADLNQYERDALSLLSASRDLQLAATFTYLTAAGLSGGAAYASWGNTPAVWSALASSASSLGAALSARAGTQSTWSQWNSLQAGFARTQQGWQFQQQLARFDRTIAGQQVTVETDGVRIAEQERRVSEIQADSAEELLEFQQAKFTSVDLYDWMAEVLERTYRWYLQQATSMAQLAAQQLAFERQEGEPPAIQADYWEPPAQGLDSLAGGTGPDRRGVTGAERLLQDIAELEQYAFVTNQRKLQITKTFSLAELDPLALARLRKDGVVTFATHMRRFDEDFPGHHHRLIRRVSVSVVALIPPTEGIHAELATTGTSRVVVGPDVFQTIVLRRPPESVALSAPGNATGLFTFEPPTGIRDPFEGLGVDTTWELRLPKPANLFDFSSLADVLMTIDYTALENDGYRTRVIRELDQMRDGERGLSMRFEFADAWWDLHNPDQSDTPLQVSFATNRWDFPPNLDELTMDHVALSLIVDSAPPAELSTVTLRFIEEGSTARIGAPAAPVDGVISTRRANGGPWLAMTGKSPLGRWEFSIPNSEDVRDWIAGNQLTDVLLVLSYRGQTAAWPT